jgi:5-methylcytosine-specific restriction endonuclease McrA
LEQVKISPVDDNFSPSKDKDMDLAIPQGVLVLNRFWQAVHICSVRRAFTLLYMGHAQVVEGNGAGDDFRTFDFNRWRELSRDYEGEDAVRTISFRIRIPRVIVLMLFDRIPKKEVKLTRQNIFERDSYTCQYCGEVKDRRDLNLDHVIPRDHGGTTTWENVVCSCIPCNTRKGNRRPPQASMKLIRKPKRPKLRTFLNVQISRNGPETWRHFLDLAYWNVELSD